MHVRTQFPVSTLAGWDGYPGGLVYFEMLGMLVARQYAVPYNKNTDEQKLVRGFLTISSQAFSELTDNERAAWATFATNHPRTYLGATYTMQEMAAYVWINFYRQLAGEAISDVAPTTDPDWAVSAIDTVAYNSGTTTLTFNVTHNKAVVANQFLMVRASPALASAQRHARKSDFRLVEGAVVGSMPALPESAAAATFDEPIFSWTDQQWIDIQVVPVNDEYVPGTAYTHHGQVTVT